MAHEAHLRAALRAAAAALAAMAAEPEAEKPKEPTDPRAAAPGRMAAGIMADIASGRVKP